MNYLINRVILSNLASYWNNKFGALTGHPAVELDSARKCEHGRAQKVKFVVLVLDVQRRSGLGSVAPLRAPTSRPDQP